MPIAVPKISVVNTPASADDSILWSDIRSSIDVRAQPAKRQVSSILGMNKSQDWLYGITLNETHTGRTYFRLWRFYPGPPPPGGWE